MDKNLVKNLCADELLEKAVEKLKKEGAQEYVDLLRDYLELELKIRISNEFRAALALDLFDLRKWSSNV